MVQFTRATKRQIKLRMAIDGASGSGKTYTALIAATALKNGGRVALIDTERGSADRYADMFDFDTLDMRDAYPKDTFDPANYIEALHVAETAGYDVVIIDSITPEWDGDGGVLQKHDQATKRNGGNSFTAWKDVNAIHDRFISAMLDCSCHLIVTMRSKMDHVQTRDEKTGRNVVEKLGMAPIQRNGVEYEFDVVGDMNQTHDLIISKTRCFAIADAVVNKPTGQWFQTLKTWLSDGAPAPEKPAQEEREPHEVGEHGERKTTPPKVTVVQNGKPARPYDPETLKKGIAQRVARAGALAADEGQRGALVGALNALFASDAKEIQTNKRHMVLQYLTGKDSSKNLTGAEIAALLPWTSERLAETNEYVPDPMAIQEAALIVKALI